MSNLNKTSLTESFEKIWLEALENKNFQDVTKFMNSGTEESECAKNANKEYAFNYDVFHVSKDMFEHIQELRIYRQPDDIKIYDDVFGHDIKRIHIWDKTIPEKYCDIQKIRNSLEEVYIYSKHGFDHLSIISPSCRKVEVQFFKVENIEHVSLKTSDCS
uniref:Uncharacterized protein n=1 Tax=Panagrolaimus davidi TaxID=227884 RepID=A0A914PET7_9BILA